MPMSALTAQAQKILMKAYNLRNEGKVEASLKQAKSVAKKHGDNLHVVYLLGSLYLEKRDYKKAEIFFKKGIALDPKGHMNQGGLGSTYYRMGNLEEAHPLLETALQKAPEEYSHMLNLANVSLALGKIDAAENLFQKLFVKTPGDVDIARDLSEIYIKQEEYETAKKVLVINLEKNPDNIDALSHLAGFYESRSLINETKNIIDRILKLDPKNIPAYYSLINIASQEGDTNNTIEYLKFIINNSDEILNPLAVSLKMKRAEDVFGDQFDAAKEKILALINKPEELALIDTSNLFNLSFIYEHFGLFEDAFTILEMANEKKKKTNAFYDMEFDQEHFTKYIDKIKNYQSWPDVLSANDCDDDRMVFILAMPRSGTTLLEQILAAHPLSDGIGESINIDRLKRMLAKKIVRFPPEINWPEQFLATSPEERIDLTNQFIEGVNSSLTNKGAKRIVEKSIGNFLYVGLLAAIFPNAHFIHCRRNRAASGLSIYQQDFSNQFLFDSDLDDINFMFDIIEEIMSFWKELLGDRIITVDYEDLVKNPEEEARAVISHIGLEWDPACLEFYKQKRVIKTASLHQARNAVYSSSADRYLNYKDHLGALLK